MYEPRDERRLSRRRMLGLGLAALFLPGCGPKQPRTVAPMILETASPANPVPAAPQAVQVSPTIKLFGVLSPEELERCYTPSQATNVGLSRSAPQPTPAVVENSVAPADPRWDVGLGRAWRHIVVHHSATDTGSAESFHKSHLARGWDGLGYHFVIGNGTGSRNGEVEIGYRWKKQLRGAHAGNLEYNEHGIGICLVGDFESGHATQAQMASLHSLVRFLQAKCGIPASEVIGHCNVPGKETRCPGAHFPMAAFKRSLSSTAVSSAAVPGTTRTVAPVTVSGAGCP